MSLPRYSKYKDSEVEWLGKVPDDWKTVPIKYMATDPDSIFLDGDWIESKDISSDGIRYITTGNIGVGKYKEQGDNFVTEETFVKLNCTEVLPGDILISRLNNPIGRAAVIPRLDSKIVTSVDNVIFRPNSDFSRKYFVYLFSCVEYFKHTSDLARGATMQRISRGLLGNIRIIVPSYGEQTQIARFLDHETAKIDALIHEQERLIKLLQEKRQAVISHAVTKGLDPCVPMKDSGVEWLGEVPAHWEVCDLTHALYAIGDVDHFMPESVDKGVPYVMTGDLTEFASSINFERCKQVSHNDYLKLSGRIKSSKGDVIMARYATIGTASYIDVDREFLVSYSCVTIKPNPSKALGLFIFNYFKSLAFFQGIRQQVNTNTQGNVGVNDLRKIKVMLPNVTEQAEIIEYLALETAKMDSLTEEAQKSIKIMQERRSALISAAVTGKIDVRNWQPPKDESAFDETVRQAGLEATA